MSTTVDERSGRPDIDQTNQNRKPNKKEAKKERDGIQKENLVDDEIPEYGDSHVSSSHEASLEPVLNRREDLCKHSVYTHFPKDRNCEICQRTKITTPCRRRNGEAVPREYFGDLMTADHKVLNESCDIHNHRRYAIVVQDLTT